MAKTTAETESNVQIMRYIQEKENRFEEAIVLSDDSIPVINFSGDREHVMKEVAEACQQWGFFQATNHGIPDTSIKGVLQVAKAFFDLRSEEKESYNALNEKLRNLCKDPAGVIQYGEILKDKIMDWRVTLRLNPSEAERLDVWPKEPASFRDVVKRYLREVTVFEEHLLDIISDGLGLENDYLRKSFGQQRQVLLMNYYPPYKRPELMKGISSHSDPSAVTILLQDSVSGLEVCNQGRWIPVEPIENAFVINLGDMLQILTNGKYKSAEHRARVHPEKARISIPVFYGPSQDTLVAPIPALSSPAMYKEVKASDYLRHFHSRALNGKSALDHMKL